MTLGQKIKKLRNEKGLTQRELADQVHVTFQTVSKWEKDENEPDVSTLRELARLFDCSLDYLLSEDDAEEAVEEEREEAEETSSSSEETRETERVVVIHEREKHVCEKCRLDIPDGELEMEDVLVSHGGRGRSAEYRKAYYHRSCLAEVRREREAAERREAARKASRAKKLSFGWGIAGGIIAFAIALLVFLLVPECKAAIHPALAVLYSVLIGYGIFAMLYCIITGSYIGDVFVWCAKLSIRFPGIIFSWSIEGFAWLIVMKILFAILGFIIGVLALIFAVIVSASLGGISFPFVLIHNIHTNYRDAF